MTKKAMMMCVGVGLCLVNVQWGCAVGVEGKDHDLVGHERAKVLEKPAMKLSVVKGFSGRVASGVVLKESVRSSLRKEGTLANPGSMVIAEPAYKLGGEWRGELKKLEGGVVSLVMKLRQGKKLAVLRRALRERRVGWSLFRQAHACGPYGGVVSVPMSGVLSSSDGVFENAGVLGQLTVYGSEPEQAWGTFNFSVGRSHFYINVRNSDTMSGSLWVGDKKRVQVGKFELRKMAVR